MSNQPNNILLSFTNVDTLSTDGGRSNTTNYYYKDGEVYIDGQENIPEFKRLDLSNEQLSKTTRVISRFDSGMNGGTYVSPDGTFIDYDIGDEVFVVHNYTGDNDKLDDKERIPPDSWWYDISLHKMYRVYLVVGSTTSEVRNKEQIFAWKVKEVKKVYRSHTEDLQSGIYSFPSPPPEDIGITGSVKIETNSGGNVWKTVNLNLFYNNSIIGSTTVDTTTTTLPTTMNVLVDRTKDSIQSNDKLRMSVQVSGVPSPHNDALIVTEYSMSISSPSTIDSPETILGFSNNLGLARDFDCQPTINNTMVARQSEFVQDVDYSISSEGSGSLTPQNLSQIRNNQAKKAAVPDSNYTQYSSVIPKYYGTKTNREGINISTAVSFNSSLVDDSTESDLNLSPFYFTTDNLGSFPNVESKNTYLGYFEKIIDPYPVLNNKTAYYVKYLVDKNTDVLDPSLTIQGLNNLKNTFKLNDVNDLPTSVKASVQNIDEARELKDLEELSTVFKVGSYPSPILYSQISSIDYSREVVMSGSSAGYLVNFDLNTEGYRNLAFTATEIISEESVSTPSNPVLSLGKGSRFRPEDDITYIPESPNEKAYTGTGEIAIEEDPTDDYRLTVEYEFFTTHIPPQLNYTALGLDTPTNLFSNTEFGQFRFSALSTAFAPSFSTYPNKNGVRIINKEDIDVQLIAWSTSNEINTGNSQVVSLEPNKRYVESGASTNIKPLVETYSDGYFQINFNSEQIYNALNTTGTWPLYLRTRNAMTSWINRPTKSTSQYLVTDYDKVNSIIGYEQGNYLQWKVRFSISVSERVKYTNLGIPGEKPYNIQVTREGNINALTGNDLYFKNNGSQIRSFNPPDITSSDKDKVTFDLRGNNTPSQEDLGKAEVPYWDYLPGSTNRSKIYLKNRLLNTSYDKNYYQVGMEYKPEANTDFPFATEPSFVNIPSPSDQWSVEIGDEIRFENLESKTFTIKNVYKQVINDDVGEFERVVLEVDREITQGIILDFFLIRRYKPSNNFVILNQQKPYGVPPSASSSPGILQTQYQSEELETNPDKVITNLIERDLI